MDPKIEFGSFQDFIGLLTEYRQSKNYKPSFLDVGGGNGVGEKYADGFNYSVLEIPNGPKHPHKNTIYGDICKCTEIKDNTYDIVYSNDVFEHILEPWVAADEMVRICKPKGLIITVTLFSWRYHPVPVDTFRYTHQGLEFLFTRTNKVKTLIKKYDIRKRRSDSRGGKMEGGVDVPPIDELGGWRENWKVLYVCNKI